MAESSGFQSEIDMLKRRLAEIEGSKVVNPFESAHGDRKTEITDRRIESAYETTQKSIVAKEREAGEEAESPWGPVGVDVGTTNIVMAQNKGNNIHIVKQLNAFFTIPQSKFTKKILSKNEVTFYELLKEYYIIGYSAENFANMFNSNTRKTMEKGLLSSRENEGVTLMQAIIGTLIQKPKKFGEVLCFSVPGDPVDGPSYVPGHESILRMYFESIGYSPVPINEGLAVVMSELADENFTGIGISMGGGMCNICLSYLSVPVITYSIQKGGDYVDEMVSRDTGLPATKVKVIKEESLNLAAMPKDRVEMALHIYYMDVINDLVQSIQHVITSSSKIPKITAPIPIILSGGTSIPNGCKEKFEKSLNSIRLPIEISRVVRAKDPLNATAKGALVMAMSEER